jgi:predicted PurR-regulated permease PerM
MNSIFRMRFAWYLVAAVVAGLLLYLVAPILSPFLFAAILAYICLPPVDRLAKRLPRWLAAASARAIPGQRSL